MSFLSHKYTIVVGRQISIHRRGSTGLYLETAMMSCDNAGQQTFDSVIQDVTGDRSWRGEISNIAFAYPYVHHLLLPWNPDILSPSERRAYAQSALEKQYELSADDWICDIAWQRFGSPAIVCAIQRKMVDDVVASCVQLRLKAPRIGSFLVDAISARLRRQEKNALFVVRQHDCCEFAFRREGHWSALLAMPAAGRTIEQLVLAACVSAGDVPEVVQICDLMAQGGMPDACRLLQATDACPEQLHVCA